eukprot:3063955-Heterocapsa_arctica.AAC.1
MTGRLNALESACPFALECVRNARPRLRLPLRHASCGTQFAWMNSIHALVRDRQMREARMWRERQRCRSMQTQT